MSQASGDHDDTWYARPALDVVGLILALTLSPVLAKAVALLLLQLNAPSRAQLSLHPVAAFALSFVVLDYLQYWSHRLMHSRALWRVHMLHHTVQRMNGIAAMRHSIAELVLSPTLWVHGAILYVLRDPYYYLLGMTTGWLLDCWRHSALWARAEHGPARVLRALLLTPEDHRVHHVEHSSDSNYGANLKLWDRMHGTHRAPDSHEEPIGVRTNESPLRLLLWPTL